MLRLISGRPDAPADECADLVRRCGGLPLALRIAGSRLASRPSWPVAHLAARLADSRRLLDELQLDGSGVRASLRWSVGQLAGSGDPVDCEAVSLLPLLARSAPSVLKATTALDRLVAVNLLTEPEPGQYVLHNLVKAFARELGTATSRRP